MADVSEKHRVVARDIARKHEDSPDSDRILLSRQIAAALANAEREGMKRGYLAGFNASGEGWNAEYPFQDQCRSPEGSTEWVNSRDRFLSESGSD